MRREFKNICESIRVLCTLTVKFTVNKINYLMQKKLVVYELLYKQDLHFHQIDIE